MGRGKYFIDCLGYFMMKLAGLMCVVIGMIICDFLVNGKLCWSVLLWFYKYVNIFN